MLKVAKTAAIVAALFVATLPAGAGAAPSASATVREAQVIMRKFGIPSGPVDGLSGRQTSRGLCAFRHMSGLPVTRNNLDSTTLTRLRQYNAKYRTLNAIPAMRLSGATTYAAVQKTCQVMFYVEGARYQRVMATSTGNGKTGHETKSGTYLLGYTSVGWHCSTIYPESCAHHPGVGRFATKGRTYGNMYNKRHVYGGVFVHGSTSVPTYPASHGCIRVTPADADWMYDHVGNGVRPPIIILGAYKW